MSEYVAECSNCGRRTRYKGRIGEEHNSVTCGKGGPGVFKEL